VCVPCDLRHFFESGQAGDSDSAFGKPFNNQNVLASPEALAALAPRFHASLGRAAPLSEGRSPSCKSVELSSSYRSNTHTLSLSSLFLRRGGAHRASVRRRHHSSAISFHQEGWQMYAPRGGLALITLKNPRK
jgi:hypothetical protein